MPHQSIRLVKYISQAGAASRRAAGDLVKAGRVRVNGSTVTEPGLPVAPDDRVELDGVLLRPADRKVTYMLNKPRGYVCTNADPHAARKAVDLIAAPPGIRLFSAGRLDKDSEGLILFSNDGDYVATLCHPRHEITKTYLVTVASPISPEGLERIRAGIRDQDELLRVRSIEPCGGNVYCIVLNEGRKREIRRVTAAVGSPTLRLQRIRVGRLTLGDLPVGQSRKLNEAEIALTLQR